MKHGLCAWVALGSLAWAGCSAQPAPDAEGTAHPRLPIALSLATDKDVYVSGEPVILALTARNTGGSTVTLQFSSSQRYDFAVVAPDGDVMWLWSAERVFAQVLGTEELPPGASLNFDERFEGRLPPGEYDIVATLVTMDEAQPVRRRVRVR